MRTLQEKYNGIQEGTFSKDHFLAEARMQQPQLITRFNGYDDAVQILKNKGMIQEAKKEEVQVKEASYKTSSNSKEAQHLKKGDIIGSGDEVVSVSAGVKTPAGKVEVTLKTKSGSTKTSTWGKTTKVGVKPVTEAKLTEAKVYSFTLTYNDAKYVQRVLDDAGVDAVAKAGTFDDEVTIRAFDGMGLRRAKQALEADHFDINENVSEAKQPKGTKKGLADYRYKPTNEMDKYPYEQILRGLRVELEGLGVQGTPTAEQYAKALATVSKNLAKDSIFYTNQVAGVNPKVDLHDKMITATAKNTVDTFNGMKKAELKEGFKKLIKKVLSESMGDFVGDKERAERSANYGQPGKNEYEFYSDPENYNDAEEEFELQGEEDLDESKMGDVYQIAQEYDRFEDFVQAVEDEFGPVEDIAELEHIFNSTRGEDDIDYGDENFSDAEIDGDSIYETRKAKSLSELLK